MTARMNEADDLDLLLRAALRDLTAGPCDSARVWSRLRVRLEDRRRAAGAAPLGGTPGERTPREWMALLSLLLFARLAR